MYRVQGLNDGKETVYTVTNDPQGVDDTGLRTPDRDEAQDECDALNADENHDGPHAWDGIK